MNGETGKDARGGWKGEGDGIKGVAKAAGEEALFSSLSETQAGELNQDPYGKWATIAASQQSLANSKTGKWLTRLAKEGNHFRVLDPPSFGGRVFVFERGWLSYSAAAHGRRVSGYQFKSPGEWFAEAYATYHDTPENRGANLDKVDSATKKWLDEKKYVTPAQQKKGE